MGCDSPVKAVLAVGLAAVAMAVGPPARAGAPCTQPAANCQLPDQGGHGQAGIVGATSDAAAGFQVVDNFVVDAGGFVTSICWWGFYLNFNIPADCSPGGVPDAFTVTYYDNDPGCADGAPATIKAGPFAVTVTRQETGNVIPSGAGDLVEWEYAATHASVPVGPGECVWVSVQNDTLGADPP